MSKEKSNTTKLGLFVILSFLIFTIAIYNIGNKQNMFGSTFEVNAIFKEVNGLQTGNSVRFSGINVGTIQDITMLNDTSIQVEMRLEKKIKGLLKKDAVAMIGSDGLVGNMVINIKPGKGGGEVAEPGTTILSAERPATAEMLNTLGSATDNISQLTIELLSVAENLNRGSGSLPRLINDSGLADDLESTIVNLKATSENLNSMSGQFANQMEEINEGEGVLGYLLTDTTFKFRIDQITDGLDDLIRDRTQPIMENLELSSHDIAETSNKLKQIVQQVDLSDGLIGTLLNDSIVSEDFKKTIHQLNESTLSLNENMEALKHNFLFRGYFKKLARKEKREAK